MTSLALTVKPRSSSGGGGGGSKQPIRRTRSTSSSAKRKTTTANNNTRMSLNSTIPTSSTRRTRKNYTQTLVEERRLRSKSRQQLKQQQQQQQKQQQQQQQQQQKPQKQSSLMRSRSFSKPRNRSRSRNNMKSTPMTLLYTSALFDPTLARNKNKSNNNTPEEDHRDANNPQSRDDNNNTDETRDTTTTDDDDPPKMVTIPPQPQKSLIDTFGDAVVDANDALVALVCDNEAVTKTIFPYVDGEFFAPPPTTTTTPMIETTRDDNGMDNVVGIGKEDKEDKEEDQNSAEDFYTGVNHTLSEEGFEATPSALYAAVEKSNNDDDDGDGGDGVNPAAVVVAGTAAAAGAAGGVFSMSKLGKLMKRQKKGKKKGGKSNSEDGGKGEAAEAEPTDDSYLGEGQEVQRGHQTIDNSSASEVQGQTQEAEVLLSIYDPELDNSTKRVKRCSEQVEEEDEGTIVEGQDLELEMMGDRNVLALGFGAFAVCSGDDNTIVTTDQRELTLQDYTSNPAQQQMELILEDESNDILDSVGEAKETRRERELRQKRRVLRGRMKARNIRAAKKALAAQEFMLTQQSSQPKSVVANDNEKLSEEVEPIFEDENTENTTVTNENTIVEDENTIITAENWECTLDDYVKPKLISRISTFKSQSEKPSLENDDDLIPTSEDALKKKDINDLSNNRSVVKGVKETSEPQVERMKKKNELLDEIEQLEEIPVKTLLAAFSDDSVVLKSFEVDDGISMHSSISMATGLRKNSADVGSKYSEEVDSRDTESSDEESEASSKEASRKASSWWNMWL